MGPLQGIKVIEMAGIGPVPLCGMMMSDMGAEVCLVERKSAALGIKIFSGAEDKLVLPGQHALSLQKGSRRPAIVICFCFAHQRAIAIFKAKQGQAQTLGRRA